MDTVVRRPRPQSILAQALGLGSTAPAPVEESPVFPVGILKALDQVLGAR